MKEINVESDFKILVRVYDADGALIRFPNFDFEIEFFADRGFLYSGASARYSASRKGQALRNCYRHEDGIIVTFDSHELPDGPLAGKFIARLYDLSMTDEVRDITVPFETDIRLVYGPGQYYSKLVVDVHVPVPGLEAVNNRIDWIDRSELDQAMEKHEEDCEGEGLSEEDIRMAAQEVFGADETDYTPDDETES